MQSEKSDLTDLVIDMISYEGEDEVVSWEQVRESIQQEGEIDSIRCHIPALDTHLEGFQPGELIAVSGPRKCGKTLLCQTIDRGFWKSGNKSLWLQYEVTPRQFVESFPGAVNLDMTFTPLTMKAHVLEWATKKIAEAIAKQGISIVFIDHLHFLFEMGKMRNTSLEIGQVIRYLKFIAINLNITIFVLCHLRKTEDGKEPTDADMRDSSLIASESDVGLLIWRMRDNTRQATLKVCYSRRTGVMDERMLLVKQQNGLLEEVANV
jgi:replicative DNA helicase